jgi:predicted  nucleic acid-binding Zn-ribbon protein
MESESMRLRGAIAALDLEIYHLRDRLRPGNHALAAVNDGERDSLCTEIERLVGRKAELREELARAQAPAT